MEVRPDVDLKGCGARNFDGFCTRTEEEPALSAATIVFWEG